MSALIRSSAVPRRRLSHPLLIEAIEPRRLLAASLAGNVLQIAGTSVADAYTAKLSGTNLVVQRGSDAAQTFARAAVAKIVATLGDGNDSIAIDDAVSAPASIAGGNGDDTLRGGTGNDTVSYAGQTEAVTATVTMEIVYDSDPDTGPLPSYANGHGTGTIGSATDTYAFIETIVGGDGDDTLLGQNGRDFMQGNTGADYLIGGGGNDVLSVDAGSDGLDTLSVDAGSDGLDTLSGNGGSDEAYADVSALLSSIALFHPH